MLETPPVPLWLDIGKAVIGPLIAAIVFIVGLLWRDRIERRNAARVWFDQTYITDGLDVVIGQVSILSHAISGRTRAVLPETNVVPLPSPVLFRLLTFMPTAFLTGIETVEAIAISATRAEHPIKITSDEYQEVLGFCISLGMYAESIRYYLMSTAITAKTDVYKLNKNTHFLAVLQGLHDQFKPTDTGFDDLSAINNRMIDTFAPRIREAAKALHDDAQKKKLP
jgi:hypothetical protein